MNTFKSDMWVLTKDILPMIEDASILVEFPNGTVEMVQIEDYFKPIESGLDKNGEQLYTFWYILRGIKSWHPIPKGNNHATK